MKQTTENIIEAIQEGRMNMLDFVMLQDDLRDNFIIAMKLINRDIETLTSDDASQWLTKIENNLLYES